MRATPLVGLAAQQDVAPIVDRARGLESHHSAWVEVLGEQGSEIHRRNGIGGEHVGQVVLDENIYHHLGQQLLQELFVALHHARCRDHIEPQSGHFPHGQTQGPIGCHHVSGHFDGGEEVDLTILVPHGEGGPDIGIPQLHFGLTRGRARCEYGRQIGIEFHYQAGDIKVLQKRVENIRGERDIEVAAPPELKENLVDEVFGDGGLQLLSFWEVEGAGPPA